MTGGNLHQRWIEEVHREQDRLKRQKVQQDRVTVALCVVVLGLYLRWLFQL